MSRAAVLVFGIAIGCLVLYAEAAPKPGAVKIQMGPPLKQANAVSHSLTGVRPKRAPAPGPAATDMAEEKSKHEDTGMGNNIGKEMVPEACTDEPEPGVTNAFEHDEKFPMKAYEGHQLRINEVFQKAAEALEEFESRKENRGKRLPFLLPSNFHFVDAASGESVSRGRYTGFAMKAVLVENDVTVKQAKKCEKTRHQLAPEILKGKRATATSASYSLYAMYFDALKKQMKLTKTKDGKYHFVEEATMHKGPVTETGWWELNSHIMNALQGGLHTFPKRRLGIETFTSLFKRTTDGRYVDSRMCVDAFEPLDYASSREVNSFED